MMGVPSEEDWPELMQLSHWRNDTEGIRSIPRTEAKSFHSHITHYASVSALLLPLLSVALFKASPAQYQCPCLALAVSIVQHLNQIAFASNMFSCQDG